MTLLGRPQPVVHYSRKARSTKAASPAMCDKMRLGPEQTPAF
jgi:hypothetical protein